MYRLFSRCFYPVYSFHHDREPAALDLNPDRPVPCFRYAFNLYYLPFFQLRLVSGDTLTLFLCRCGKLRVFDISRLLELCRHAVTDGDILRQLHFHSGFQFQTRFQGFCNFCPKSVHSQTEAPPHMVRVTMI